jgi:hypothetical protein
MKEQKASHRLRRASAAEDTQASFHRAGHSAGLHPEDRPYLTDERRPVPPRYDDVAGDAVYDTRRPTSTRCYQVPVKQGPQALIRYHQVPPRSSRTHEQPPMQQPAPRRRSEPRAAAPGLLARRDNHLQWHWSVSVGFGMIAILVLFAGGQMVLHWWNATQDNLHYGFPRTYQCDAVVGHHDSPAHPSHFIALNLDGHIEVIEFPGGDASHARVYLVSQLVGANAQETPVTLTFQDVNGDGKPDMLVHFGGETIVFLNDHGAFRPATPADHILL